MSPPFPPSGLVVLLLNLSLVAKSALAQNVQFLARPYDVNEGDSVISTYPSDESLAIIKSWKWDFNGDGTWENPKPVSSSTNRTARCLRCSAEQKQIQLIKSLKNELP